MSGGQSRAIQANYYNNESTILSYCLEVFMVRSLAVYQPTPQHWSLSANLSYSTVHMESVQLILGLPERLVMSGSNVTNSCIREPA